MRQPRIRATFALLALGLTFAGPATAMAQAGSDSTHCLLCFRPREPESCDLFPITEFGVAIRTSYERIWVLGLAHPLDRRFALDASLSFRDWGVIFVRTSVFPYDQVSRSTYALTDLPGGSSTWVLQSQEVVPQKGTITETRFGVRAGSYAGLGLGALAVLASIVVNGTIEN